jgi:hypothetical protein
MRFDIGNVANQDNQLLLSSCKTSSTVRLQISGRYRYQGKSIKVQTVLSGFELPALFIDRYSREISHSIET